uniref:FAD-binding domain-containing protein n=1 Tax=Bionectria ochroleuca TaxID=29856 RepID=A0A8H7KEU0_BIOOC
MGLHDAGVTVERNGIERYAPTRINVVICGAGVGGLLAALECYRKGHSVTVLEREPKMSIVGDVIGLNPAALSTIQKYPYLKENMPLKFHDCPISYYSYHGQFINSAMPEWRGSDVEANSGLGTVGQIITRPNHAEVMLAQIRQLGIPIVWSKKVVKYGEAPKDGPAFAETEDGERYEADVVIAADGVHSASREIVKGNVPPVQRTGYFAAHTGFPRSDLPDLGPECQHLFPRDGEADINRVYIGKSSHHVVSTSKDYVAWKEDSSEGTSTNLTPEDVISVMGDGWDPAVLKLIRHSPGSIVNWSLNFRNPHRHWTSPGGRVVQLGDAAHTFLPTSGNGAVQAMEDAISIAECLRQGGKENVGWSTQVHNVLRYQRVTTIQRTAFVNQDDLDGVDVKQALRRGPDFKVRWGRWMWSHLPEQYAADHYWDALTAIQTGNTFENTNLPPGHVFEDFTMEQELKRQKLKIPSSLKRNGDWTIE